MFRLLSKKKLSKLCVLVCVVWIVLDYFREWQNLNDRGHETGELSPHLDHNLPIGFRNGEPFNRPSAKTTLMLNLSVEHGTPTSRVFAPPVTKNASIRVHQPLLHPNFRNLDDKKYELFLNRTCTSETKRWRNALNVTKTGACECVPSGLLGNLEVNVTSLTNNSWLEVFSTVRAESGGHWRPQTCFPRRRVAVIVPYRDRERHLRAFLAHTHPVLQRQQIEYRIFVIEQRYPYYFNKGALMNVGYVLAKELFPMDCVLFHDVDLLMENDKNVAICGREVVHMSGYVDKFGYRMGYASLIGGAICITPKQFEAVNGFVSSFYGWGGEDDNFSGRLIRHRTRLIVRPPYGVARYKMIKHTRDAMNPPRERINNGELSFKFRNDGLSITKYKVVQSVTNNLYTWIQVDLSAPTSLLTTGKMTTIFTSVDGACVLDPPVETVQWLSLVSCKWLCGSNSSCVAFQYQQNGIRDQTCVLLDSMCDKPLIQTNTTVFIKNVQNDVGEGRAKRATF